MSEFGETKIVVGRKQHRCEACLHPIPIGERHEYFAGVVDGQWQHWRMHDECYKALAEDGYVEFCSGDCPPPDRIRLLTAVQS